MRQHNPKIGIMIGLILMVSGYFFVLVSADLLHNHDAEFHFHDNCPACQWTQHAFEEDTILQGMQAALEVLNVQTPDTICEETESIISTLSLPTSLTYRGPPTAAA
ncbi:hypothetical protein KAR48_08895 [bacterium]|nr:hypothetical protein [bacterium]